MAELFLVSPTRPPNPEAISPHSSPTIPDADERERALDVAQSWIVEAPAGSGKTGLLIQRFLKLLTTESVLDPSQVLAITFTRKATSEVRERVLAQLTAAQHATPPETAFDQAARPLADAVLERDAQLGWDLLEQSHRLNIRTIDSICADIARALPVLSRSGGRQSPVEDAGPLYERAARRTLLLLGGADVALNSALELLLLRRDGNLADCEALLATMLASREQWGELVPLTEHDLDDTYLDSVVLPKLEKTLDLAICRGLTHLTKLLPAPILTSLCSLAAEMADAEGYKGAASPIAICRGRSQSPQEKTEDLNHWRALIHLLIKPSKPRGWRRNVSGNVIGFEILKQHQAELKDIIARLGETPGLVDALCQLDCLPPSTYPQEQWVVAKALFRVLSHALVELQFVFAESGQCDFTELALMARSALRREDAIDDLGASSGIDLQHLLVDEMQDTSSGQYELIQLLTQRWDGHSQTVFLVGDPKQSIYLFRQARVERFIRTMRSGLLGDLPLGTLHLTANFRSQHNLVEAFNQDFSQIFPSEFEATQPEFVPYRAASAVRPARTQSGRIWHLSVQPYSEYSSERTLNRRAQASKDAFEIRRIVELWRARPLPPSRSEPWKIAVLVRSRNHLLDIVKAFKTSSDSAALPFRAIDIEPLDERQEVLDLVALTRALLQPADRTAWLALLRSPWCGLSLVDLHLLAGKDDPSWAEHNILNLIRERGDLLSEEGVARLQSFWIVMDTALKLRDRMSLSRRVERTWHAFGAGPYMTEEALTNIERYFNLLDQLEEPGGRLGLAKLSTRLKRLFAAPSLHPEAVDFMTIHGAKGLEWDVVIVPALERTGQNSPSRLLSWLEVDGGKEGSRDDTASGIIAPIKSKGTESRELNLWMRSIESAREAAERKRLFYVASTRAREELHLFAAPARKKDGSIARPAGSLLSSVWPTAEPFFAEPISSAATILRMQQPMTPQVVGTLAATGNTTPVRLIERIPSPLAGDGMSNRFDNLRSTSPERSRPADFDRPIGSFSARAFGNVMHAFLQVVAEETAKGASSASLLAQLPGWKARISAVLRANGLARALVERLTAAVMSGLSKTLSHPDGQWILAAHPNAESESSVVSWRQQRSSLRIDRTFLAGASPRTSGSEYLWIIDYKTASHGEEGLDAFLNEERKTYRMQLETYAHALAKEGQPVRLALFYPMLTKLLWWEPQIRSD